jgi:hypothetical protein
MENTIFYLLGFPGVGKYTIAKELSRLTGAKIVDNHYILNPIFSLIAQDGITPLPPKVWDYCYQIHHAVYGTIRELSPRGWSFIFTNGLVQGDAESESLYQNVLETVKARAAQFVPVRLLCDPAEHGRRIVQPQRRERMKTINVDEVEIFKGRELYHPDHPNTFTLDVTHLSPVQAAEGILEGIGRRA